MSEALVTVTGLRRVFDVSKPWLDRVVAGEPKLFLKAVDGVSFEIARGETFAVVGESGSGKSTVARMVVGLLRASDGEVVIDGVSMTTPGRADMSALRRRIQMIFQDPFASLNPRQTIRTILTGPLKVHGIGDRARQREIVEAIVAQVGLPADSLDRYPHEFSGGQR